MKRRVLGLAVSGALLFAACGQTSAPTADATADASTAQAAAQTDPTPSSAAQTLTQTISDLQTIQQRVAAGEQVPLDDQGQPVDLAALIRQYQQTLGEAQAMEARTPQFTPQGIYQSMFMPIVWDDSFQPDHSRLTRAYPGYDWSTDGCSGPAKYTGYADDFYWPCVQHDFGYRNNRLAGQHNEWARFQIDTALLRHMDQVCGRKHWYAKPACYAMAQVFYAGVRDGGWTKFY